jgi:hypothetical protein
MVCPCGHIADYSQSSEVDILFVHLMIQGIRQECEGDLKLNLSDFI